MLSPGGIDPALRREYNVNDAREQATSKKATASAHTERSASGTLDGQQVAPAPELTTSSPEAESPVISPQEPKNVNVAPHITRISNQGDTKRLPWNPCPSQTSLVAPGQQPSSSSANDRSNSDVRIQPPLYSLAEFLNDPRNLPLHLVDQPPSSNSESGTGRPSLRKQPSQLSLRRILAEGPPAEAVQEGNSNETLPSGLRQSVSQRVTQRVLSLVSPRKQKDIGSCINPTTTEATAEEMREQKTDDEQQAQSHHEAKPSISFGLDGSYLFHPPPSHPTLALYAEKPLPPLPTSSSEPHAGVRNQNTIIRPSYEIIAPYLPRARTSSTETIKTGQSSAAIGAMSSAADDIARTQRIPLVRPAWDRRVDITWDRDNDLSWGAARELSAFRVSLHQFHREAKHIPSANDLGNQLFRLPDRVRYMIAKYLAPDRATMMPIKLNNGMRLYEPVWPATYFDNLADVLRSVRPYTSVCWAMRADIFVTILNTRAFHVVMSPYSGPLLDPLAHHWFGRYAGYIQHLTIELDFTKLGFGADPAAAELKPLVTKIKPRMEEYATAQRRRDIQQDVLLRTAVFFGKAETKTATRDGGRGGLSTVHSLTVAARRYFGERPAEAGRGRSTALHTFNLRTFTC